VPVKKEGPIDVYDPSAVQSEIQKLQKERMVSPKLRLNLSFVASFEECQSLR
jgi:hypothetical protein